MSDKRLKNYILNQVDAVMLNCQTWEEYEYEIEELLCLVHDLKLHAKDDWADTQEEFKAGNYTPPEP